MSHQSRGESIREHVYSHEKLASYDIILITASDMEVWYWIHSNSFF